MTGKDRPTFSSLARVVFDFLRTAPGTVDDIARDTKLPLGVIEAALAELRSAGRAEKVEGERWRIK